MTPASSNTNQKRNGGYDWTRWISLAWAVLLVVGTGLYHAGGRLASPRERIIEVRDTMAPYIEDVHDNRDELKVLKERIRQHESVDRNDVLIERMNSLDARISRLESFTSIADK